MPASVKLMSAALASPIAVATRDRFDRLTASR